MECDIIKDKVRLTIVLLRSSRRRGTVIIVPYVLVKDGDAMVVVTGDGDAADGTRLEVRTNGVYESWCCLEAPCLMGNKMESSAFLAASLLHPKAMKWCIEGEPEMQPKYTNNDSWNFLERNPIRNLMN